MKLVKKLKFKKNMTKLVWLYIESDIYNCDLFIFNYNNFHKRMCDYVCRYIMSYTRFKTYLHKMTQFNEKTTQIQIWRKNTSDKWFMDTYYAKCEKLFIY